MFGSQLHTHLLGARVVTQHFRAGEELPELDRDNHYSTHYQEIRLLAKPVQVLPVSKPTLFNLIEVIVIAPTTR